MKKGIPKIIHQTYMTKELPVEIKENIKKLKEKNPGWEYRFYDDYDIEKYIGTYFPNIFPYFKKINPSYGVVKADLFRYLVIYIEGGVYLDIKSSFSKPFEDTLKPDDTIVLSHWNQDGDFASWGIHDEIDDPKGEFQQCFIISAPGHPFLEATIEKVVHNMKNYRAKKDGVRWLGVLRLSGPIAYTLSIKSVLNQYDYRLVDSEKDLGYIYNIYSEDDHKKVFAIHYTKNKQPIVFSSLIEKIYFEVQTTAIKLKKKLIQIFQRKSS